VNPHRHFLVAALFIAPLALGSFHPLALGVLCGVLGLSALLAAVEGRERRVSPGLLDGGLALMLGYTALQLVPLPRALTSVVWPAGDRVWQGALELAGRADAFRPLTLEPAGTAVEIVKLIAVLACFVLAKGWVRSAGHKPLLATIALVGLAAAAVSLVHRLLGLERVYDLYMPLQVEGPGLPAPLLNANHLAGLFALTAPVAVGLGLEQKDRSRRLLWIVCGGLTGMAGVITLSRGGIAALALAAGLLVLVVVRGRPVEREAPGGRTFVTSGFLILIAISAFFLTGNLGLEMIWRAATAVLVLLGGVLALFLTRSHGTRSSSWAWVVGGSLAVLAGGAYVSREAVIEEYLHGTDSKSAIWAAAWPMILTHLPFGVGRGAFAVVFPTYNTLGPGNTITHAENLLVQLAAESGLVGVVLVLTLIIGLGWLVMQGTSRPAVAGALAGAMGLLIQNLVDFSIELPGVSLPLIAVLAAATAGRRSQTDRPRRRLPARPVLGAVVGLAVVGGVTLAVTSPRSIEHDEEVLRDRARGRRPRFDDGLVRAMVGRHPADYFLPYLAGVWAIRAEEPRPLVWMNRSLGRNPSWGRSHLWVGRALWATGHESQALLEYRLAATLDEQLVSLAANEVVSRSRRFAQLAPQFQLEPLPLDFWDAVSVEFDRVGLAAEGEASDQALLEAVPDHEPALERAARRALATGQVEEGRALARRLPRGTVVATLLLAQFEAAAGSETHAVRILEHALADRPHDTRLLEALAGHRERAGDPEGARDALELLEQATPRAGLAGALLRRAAFEERAGQDGEALHLYEQAVSLGASREGLRGLARVAERRGEMVRALEAYRRLRDQGVTDEEVRAGTERVERRVDQARLDALIGDGD
jgi:tetratricopeptide (TPR) repeat protein